MRWMEIYFEPTDDATRSHDVWSHSKDLESEQPMYCFRRITRPSDRQAAKTIWSNYRNRSLNSIFYLGQRNCVSSTLQMNHGSGWTKWEVGDFWKGSYACDDPNSKRTFFFLSLTVLYYRQCSDDTWSTYKSGLGWGFLGFWYTRRTKLCATPCACRLWIRIRSSFRLLAVNKAGTYSPMKQYCQE